MAHPKVTQEIVNQMLQSARDAAKGDDAELDAYLTSFAASHTAAVLIAGMTPSNRSEFFTVMHALWPDEYHRSGDHKPSQH
jgi:hypothetical protein